MRNDLHPLLVAPSIGGQVRVRVNGRTLPATVVLGIGRAVALPSGERLEVCAPEHLLHIRCERLAGDRLLAVPAGDCDLALAPPAADAALGSFTATSGRPRS